MSIYFHFQLRDGSIKCSRSELPHAQDVVKFESSIDNLLGQTGLPPKTRLVEVGMVCRNNTRHAGIHDIERPLMDLHHLSVRPTLVENYLGRIFNVRQSLVVSGTHEAKCLAWDWEFLREIWPSGRPWSNWTGPFEYFEVEVNGKYLGEAFSTEFMLLEDASESQEVMEVQIEGKMFGESQTTCRWTGSLAKE